MATNESSEQKKLSPSQVAEISATLQEVKREVSKVFLGQERIINELLCALLSNGHVLLEGVPGIAKTLAIRTLGRVCGCSAKRIQFTVDLLPSDILGLTTYTPEKGFEIVKGPIFANFIIADEINRSPPKTQSALIEAMQEKQVTIGKTTFALPSPFFVMANQNPIENEGVYILPEAQVDRFLFKILMSYPKTSDEEKIMEDNITFKDFEDFDVKPVLSDKKILELQELTHRIYSDKKIRKYILDIVSKTREKSFQYSPYIELGCSPRASIALFIASKAWALLNGRNFVIPSDVKDIAPSVLRHRIILSYRAKAESISADRIIEEVLRSVKAS